MAYADFRQLKDSITKVQDLKFYDVEHENPTKSTDFEGGYEATRPQHFRSNYRRTFSTGWTDMTSAEKEALEAFYRNVDAGASVWVWVNPWEAYWLPMAEVAGDTFVRFIEPLRFEKKVYGDTLRWDCKIMIREM